MSSILPTEPSIDSANALLEHLRNHPEDAARNPAALAGQFRLPVGFVEEVLRGIAPPETAQGPSWQIDLSFLARFFEQAYQGFRRLTEHPTRFVVVTTLMVIAIGWGFSLFGDRITVFSSGPTQSLVLSGVTGLLALGVVALHMACYMVVGRSRFALQGGLAVWMILSTLVVISANLDPNMRAEGVSRAGNALALALVMLILCSIYAGVGCLASVLGGYLRLKRKEQRQERMTRQELIARYLDLQERLQAGRLREAEVDDWLSSPAVLRFRRSSFLYGPLISAVFGIASILMLRASGVAEQPAVESVPQAIVALGSILLSVLQVGLMLVFGYLMGHAGKAFLLGLTIGLMNYAFAFTPIVPTPQTGGPLSTVSMLTAGFATLVMAALGAIGSLGARVQEQALRDRNLLRNDPAALTAELVKVQWQLASKDTPVCVMVVDAAKSSTMKASADPLAVEYSFREYQYWIESVSRVFRGRIHSTAGDGAVVSFATAGDALAAARRLQTDLDRFNRDQNRLPLPFRLRIGLHAGRIAGNLDDVQFTEVIDVAAHIEGKSLIGGIAVSRTVVEQLPHEEFTDAQEEVDGVGLFHAVRSTEA